MRRKGVTSIELARLAGVSSATISRAFSANSRISAVTRERVLLIAREHNYHPNAMARSLNNRQSRLRRSGGQYNRESMRGRGP